MKKAIIFLFFCAIIVTRAGEPEKKIYYTYDAAGNRISKETKEIVLTFLQDTTIQIKPRIVGNLQLPISDSIPETNIIRTEKQNTK